MSTRYYTRSKINFYPCIYFYFNFYFLLESGVKEGQMFTKHTLFIFANHDSFSWYNKHLSPVGVLNQNTNKACPAVAACQTFPPLSSASLVSHSISDIFNQTDRVIWPSQPQDLYSYTFHSLAGRKIKTKTCLPSSRKLIKEAKYNLLWNFLFPFASKAITVFVL